MSWAKQIRCVRLPNGDRMFYTVNGGQLPVIGGQLPVIRSVEEHGRDGHTMTLVLFADCFDFVEAAESHEPAAGTGRRT